MIIHEPQLKESGDEITVEAAVEVERPDAAYPDTLWYTFPKTVGSFVTRRADGFATALLPLAMHLREPLTVHGSLSYRLAQGLRDYQAFQSAWKPKIFTAVELKCEGLQSRDPDEGTGAVGTAFSGGVDSFHTLWAHLRQNESYSPYRISHCLMINGFDPDADLFNAGTFPRMQALFEPMMERLGSTLVIARTNLLKFFEAPIVKQSFTAFITSPALVLGRLFSRYYVPSSYKFTHLARFQDGSSPMYDHLLSTESMQVIHDGGHLTRVAKTVTLAQWPETYDRLRVCFNATGVQEERDAIANCCACEKCVRTMVTLDIAGALGKYRCFPKPLNTRAFRRANYGTPGTRVFAEEILEYAKQAGRSDMVRHARHTIFHSALYRQRIQEVILANHRLEQRSSRWANIVRRPKVLARRLGVGQGWLY